ncbi:putative DNA-binding pseudobarrel domain superfamily [Helianthus anomalus]
MLILMFCAKRHRGVQMFVLDHLGPSCNGDCKILVDEEYPQNVKIGRSGNKLFFGRDWVKVVQQIRMKFATFVLFQYMGQRKFKLTEYPIQVNHQLIQQNDQLNSTFTVIARNRFVMTLLYI